MASHSHTYAGYRRLYSVVFFLLTAMLLRPLAFGSFIGLAIAFALYNTMPAYAAFINWQLHHPLVWLLGLPVGIAAAVINK